jgi:hypothetical protein
MHQYPPLTVAQATARLPLMARRKIAAIQGQIVDSQALIDSVDQQTARLQQMFAMAENRRARLDPHIDADDIAELGEEIDALRVDLDKLAAERARRAGLAANSQQIAARLEDFVGATAGGFFVPAQVAAQLEPGESLADGIRRVRSEIGALQAEIARVRNAPPTKEEIAQHLRREVQRLLAAGTPTVAFRGSEIEISWPDASRFRPESAPAGSPSALVAWLFPDLVFERLSEGLDQIRGGISAVDRAARSAILEADLLAAERVEEMLVEMALDQNVEVHRRLNASPMALLGIAVRTAEPALVAAE